MAAFQDYSFYSDLTDEQLLQLAIERSLTDHHGNSSLNSHNNPCNVSRTSYNSHNPPLSVSSTSYNSHNPPLSVSSTHYNSHNPPSEAPPDPKTFDGTISRFMSGSGRHMVAYRRRDGMLVYVAPEPEEEEEPLFAAIRHGDTSLVRALLPCSSSLVQAAVPGWLALHQAAWYGQEACLHLLLAAQPGMVNMRTGKEQTALLLAVAQNHISCVSLLLQRGADPNLMSRDRETPLYKACEKDTAEMVALLLTHGAQVNTACIQGWTALQEAVCRNNVEISEMLVQAGAKLSPVNIYGITPLFTAAQSGQEATLRFLMRHGADVNSQAADGATALYEATKNGHEGIVELLLSQKADANKPGKKGLLPIHVAAQKGSESMVAMLIPATSKARVRRSGISPLHLAAENNMDEVLELLIQSGFDVNAQLSEERSKMYEDRRSTALYFSVANGNLEAVSMLLAAGANPNLDVFCPLLVAVRLCSFEMASLLLEHGAQVNSYVASHPSSFPASLLFSMKYLSMLKFLLDRGGDALSCFSCTYGPGPHPPIKPARSERDELRYTERELAEPAHNTCVQFCEVISSPNMSRWAGPIIDVLLDYVGDVKLCSRLQEHLDSFPAWNAIKDKASPPRPLLQLCRLRVRQLLGVGRLAWLNMLPLPGSLIRFLNYQEGPMD